MNRHTIFRAFFLILIFFGFFSGIIRHDVVKEKYLALAKQKTFDPVGMVFHNGVDNHKGSCTLIGSKYVISAAHVFTISPDIARKEKGSQLVRLKKNSYYFSHPSKYSFKFQGDKLYKAKKLIPHPMYQGTWTCDLMLIELEEEVTGTKPATVYRGSEELGSKVVGVGFGVSGIANEPKSVAPRGEKIAGENTIDSIYGYQVEGKPTLLACDFDHPTDHTCCNKMGSATPLPLEYITGGGDSGCGLFIQKNGQWYLAGTLTGGGIEYNQFRKSGYYGQTNLWMRLSLFTNWIDQYLNG